MTPWFRRRRREEPPPTPRPGTGPGRAARGHDEHTDPVLVPPEPPLTPPPPSPPPEAVPSVDPDQPAPHGATPEVPDPPGAPEENLPPAATATPMPRSGAGTPGTARTGGTSYRDVGLHSLDTAARAATTGDSTDHERVLRERQDLIRLCLYALDRARSAGVAERIEEGLAAVGVTSLRPDGDRFDPARHEAGGVTDTEDPALAGTVAETEVVGFADRGRTLRVPVVTVYTRKEPG